MFSGLLVFLLCTVAPAPASEKHALLVGLNDYQSVGQGIARLNYAVADVDELAKALQRSGFKEPVVLHDHDARRREILKELRHLAATSKKEDAFLLYFAGHAVRGDNQATYWLTYDAELSLLDDAAIRVEHVMDYVRDIKAEQKIILVDHCFSGDVVLAAQGAADPARTNGLDATASPTPSPADGSRSASLTTVLEQRGATLDAVGFVQGLTPRATGLVVMAAARGPAYEIPSLGHGAFTAALLEALNTRNASGDDKLTVMELVSWVKTRVRALTGQDASDFVSGAGISDWELANAMPPGDAAEAEAKFARYNDRLDEWEATRRWIELATKINYCRPVLRKWLQSFSGGPRLTSGEEQILSVIQSHLELKTSSLAADEENARDLESRLRRLPSP